MQSIGIKGIGYYAPENVFTNFDFEKIIDTSDEWIRTRTGITERRFATKEQATSDLACEASLKAIESAKIKKEDIDLIILATVTPDYLAQGAACIVQHKLGLSNIPCFDLNAACTGFIYGLEVGYSMVKSGLYKNVLVIGAETLSRIIDMQNRNTCVLFGDGAGGVLLEASDQKSFLAESLFTDGSRGASLESCYLGLSSPYSDDVSDRRYLTMDGRAVFDFAIRDVTKSIQKMIADASMEAEEIDYFLLHQANDRMLDKMSKKLGVSREKIPANMMEYGNTSAASIPILLSECVENHRIKMDGSQKILLTGFGGGLTWGTLLVTI